MPRSFKLKNPRKGTETISIQSLRVMRKYFQIKESPEGDWNFSPNLVERKNSMLSN